jgi:hypothetical protein
MLAMSRISIRRILKTSNVGDSNRLALSALPVGIATGQVPSRCLLLATSRASQLAGFAPPHAG